ncbi:alpha/beta fold hydrolase [Nocardia panacis]|uniref:alpha/beta fold hydrolase n=1 Tax=Nocardia panacis TaxID=2340916 RepID=UPI0019393DF8|nr:alpha/beta hydrolase [Nocardia panacis]
MDWHQCADAGLVKEGAQCAEVTVPLDYGRLTGPTMKIAVSRIEAKDKDNRQGVLLSNPGGPASSGLDAFDLIGDVIEPEVLNRYDVIGFDPRGVARSGAPKPCGWPVSNPIRSAGVDLAGFVAETLLQAQMAGSCLTWDATTPRYLTTRNTARDMDVIRGVLGAPRISYFGLSYGTYLGAVYTQMFPGRTDRMVYDSVVDPGRYWLGMQQDWGAADEAGLDDWAAWTAEHDDTYHLGATAPEVRAGVEGLIQHAARTPIPVAGFGVDEHLLPNILWTMLRDARLNDTLARTIRTLVDLADGRSPEINKELLQQVDSARTDEYSVMAMIWCGDAPMPADPAWYWRAIEAARPTQPVFAALANNIQPCAFWPAPLEPPTVVDNAAPALILQATGDNRTPYVEAVGLHQKLSASRLVTLQDVRIHMVLRPGLSSCVLDTANAYFRDGTLPEEDRTCYANPTPAEPHPA